MLEYIRFYDTSSADFICYSVIDGNKKRVFPKEKREIISIIKKYKIKPSAHNEEYVQYSLSDFKKINQRDLRHLYLAATKNNNRKVNREKSKKIKKQIIGIASVAALVGFVGISVLLHHKNKVDIASDIMKVESESINNDIYTSEFINNGINGHVVSNDTEIKLEDIIEKIPDEKIINEKDEVIVEDDVIIESSDNYDDIYDENLDELEEVDQIVELPVDDMSEFLPPENITTPYVPNDYYESSIKEKCFNYKSVDNSNDSRVSKSMRFIDKFNKYGEMYGCDPKVLMAIAAQETGGINLIYSEGRPAIGLMQIEIAIWNNENVSAYNFNTGSWDKITIDLSKLSDLDYNVKVAAMILQTNLVNFNYNIPLAIQGYNMGYGNIKKVLNSCSSNTGLTVDNIINTPTNNVWLNYTEAASGGNMLYVPSVFSFIESGSTLYFRNVNGQNESVTINNQNVNNYSI